MYSRHKISLPASTFYRHLGMGDKVSSVKKCSGYLSIQLKCLKNCNDNSLKSQLYRCNNFTIAVFWYAYHKIVSLITSKTFFRFTISGIGISWFVH